MKKARILITEDEQIVAEDLKMALEAMGYSIIGIASSGERAIELADREKPDLILMDIILSGKMDGIAAAYTIRSRHDIPVIYLTAYADSTLLERAKQTEPLGYIVKPFNEREVHSNIEIALFKHHMESEIKKRDAILFALGFGVEWFLRQLSLTHRVETRGVEGKGGFDCNPILEQIGLAMNLNRILMFKFSDEDRDPLSLLLVHEWVMAGTPQAVHDTAPPAIPLSHLGITGKIHEFQAGKPVLFPHAESESIFFTVHNIDSACAIPVFVSDRLWGAVFFTDSAERIFSGEEVEAMKIAVNILGGVISLFSELHSRLDKKIA